MTPDIDLIIQRLREEHPDVRVEQLEVKFKGADDDGLWFFRSSKTKHEVQLESSDGNCPFLIETNEHDHGFRVLTIEDALKTLEFTLHLGGQ